MVIYTMSDEEKICVFIQNRIDACENGNLKAYVNPAFLLEEGSGYMDALYDIRKGLKKRDLWVLPEDYENPYKHNPYKDKKRMRKDLIG